MKMQSVVKPCEWSPQRLWRRPDRSRMIKGQSEYLSMGLLGLSGLTAYSAVYGECDLKKDQVVVVSGAAG